MTLFSLIITIVFLVILFFIDVIICNCGEYTKSENLDYIIIGFVSAIVIQFAFYLSSLIGGF